MSPTVVTTLPAATELVMAVGVTPAAVSHACDYPPTVTELPVVTAPTEDGRFALRTDRLREMDPDVVITQGTCELCAIDTQTVTEQIETMSIDPTIVETDVHTLGDLYADIERIGAVIGRPDAATQLNTRLQDRVEQLTQPQTAAGPRTVVFDWMDPVMVAGHWVPELVSRAGGQYELETAGQPARPREWETIRSYDPEVIMIAPCGYDIDQTVAHRTALTDRPGWAELTAVQANQVYIVDGSQYVNRPGPRLVETLGIFASLLTASFDFPYPADAVRHVPAR